MAEKFLDAARANGSPDILRRGSFIPLHFEIS